MKTTLPNRLNSHALITPEPTDALTLTFKSRGDLDIWISSTHVALFANGNPTGTGYNRGPEDMPRMFNPPAQGQEFYCLQGRIIKPVIVSESAFDADPAFEVPGAQIYKDAISIGNTGFKAGKETQYPNIRE